MQSIALIETYAYGIPKILQVKKEWLNVTI